MKGREGLKAMVRAGFVATLIAAATVSGCEPGWSINGQVVQPAVSSAPGTPLRGALVVLRCYGPSGTGEQVTRADEQGVFQLAGTGPGPRLDCALTVAKDGYGPPLVFSIDQICADEDESEGRCSAAALQAELAPQQP
jgi:hypothetical protein